MLNIDVNIDSKSIIVSVFLICTTTLLVSLFDSCGDYEKEMHGPIKSGDVRVEGGYRVIGTDSTMIFTNIYSGKTMKIVNRKTGELILDNE